MLEKEVCYVSNRSIGKEDESFVFRFIDVLTFQVKTFTI